MGDQSKDIILSIRGMSKSFGRNRVLDHINLDVRKGTVMGLMGENGAGKSTMMKCLFGTYQKDEGTIYLDGKEVNFSGPKDALENGIAMVHQELNQCLERNVVDNLFLGRYPVNSLGMIDEGRMKNEASELFRKLGMIAEKTGCAIVLIGHLNKSSGTQSTYRGLGSIDIMAAVRSLLFIGKVKKDPTTRVLIHEKSSLAPPGETMAFKLGDEEGFRWVGAYEISADDLLDGKEGKPTETKLQRGTKLIYELLADGNAVTIRELDEKAKAQGISQRTMREARSRMKEELDYRMNEKQENTIRLKKQGRMGDGRILE